MRTGGPPPRRGTCSASDVLGVLLAGPSLEDVLRETVLTRSEWPTPGAPPTGCWRPTVEAMATDQLSPGEKAISGFCPGYFGTRGWGFGVSTTTARHVADRRGQSSYVGSCGVVRS
ncbi:hypothetical protein GCM10027445_63120 [Amycolatopsis endophytica]|uniref:Uncharacterized protein n=1 Tax=Amycolatopsis endophytica TaxID=860233 RepID=A0A853AY55_9PSEU|nr:hypothetical protein [Amycolatopsis endophytica]NYI87577.1 hypothetical protein [Amycolatopsis endophytica]